MGSSLDGSIQATYAERNAERRALQAEFEMLPRDFESLERREAGVIGSMTDVSVDAFRSEIEVGRALAEVESLRELAQMDAVAAAARGGGTAARDLDRTRGDSEAMRPASRSCRTTSALRRLRSADDVMRSEALKQELIRALEAEGALDRARVGAEGRYWPSTPVSRPCSPTSTPSSRLSTECS